MTNLKAVIVDEERLARVNLRRLLEKNALRTFEGNNIDYLTKPVNPDRLREAIERVKTGNTYFEIEKWT